MNFMQLEFDKFGHSPDALHGRVNFLKPAFYTWMAEPLTPCSEVFPLMITKLLKFLDIV